jgi:hypothetical protein
MSLITPDKLEAAINDIAYDTGNVFVKAAETAETVYALAGRLYVSSNGNLMLSVPNSFVRGAFDAIDEVGVELPPDPSGKLNAHISVAHSTELDNIGGPDKITERGHSFRYTLGKVKTCVPSGWEGVSRVWFVEVQSPELQNLRKSYGLTPLPKYPFHVTIAVRKTNVLRNNEVAKG